MALLLPDNLLFIVFGLLSMGGLTLGVVSFALAIKFARQKEGELRMALWAIVGLAGLVVAGMSWAYFLIPIIIHRVF